MLKEKQKQDQQLGVIHDKKVEKIRYKIISRKVCLMLLGAFFMFGCNATFFYYPSRDVFSTPDDFGLKYESVVFSSQDETKLSGWYIPSHHSRQAKGTIIQFHGNAENMTSHYRSLLWVVLYGYNLFVFDYRGYGQSGGEPHLQGSIEDSIAAIEYVKKRSDIDSRNLVIIGQSLGGALAIATLARKAHKEVRLVIIENAFSSYRTIAQEKMWDFWLTRPLRLPLSWLISDTYSPEELVSELSPVPVLFVHGTHDTIVPFHHSEILYQRASHPKYMWRVEGGEHLQTFQGFEGKYRERLLTFLEKILKNK